MQNVMIDLETVDSVATAGILSIGAVFFDPMTGEMGPTYYRVVDWKDCLTQGCTESQATMDWWAQQSDEARRVFTDNGMPLREALVEFRQWLLSHGSPKFLTMWSNGADFDLPILQHVFKLTGVSQPWMFWNNRCYRTLKALGSRQGCREPKREGIYHNALHDAEHQAKHLIDVYRVLGLDK